MGKLEPLPGTSDLWHPEAAEWVRLENTARRVMGLYGYAELRTPIIERTDVFVRGIGSDTEVVQKEMYTFTDRGDRSLTLRPEGTAGVMRAIANQGVGEGEEKRVFYCGPMFRGERPAAGRKRQFHQIGVEAVGKLTPLLDAESMVMLFDYLRAVGIDDFRLLLNSRGTREDRQDASRTLQEHFRPHVEEMCEDCRRRLDSNVWRILDCKVEACRGFVAQAPPIVDLLSETSRAYFGQVQRALDAFGIAYEVAPHLVRGLDYYEHTVFEVVSDSPHLGAQNALAGGGRYLIELPGSRKPIPGVGFALGMERLMMARHRPRQESPGHGPVDVFIAILGDQAEVCALQLSRELRARQVRVLCETEGRSIKAQMRTADKCGAELAVIVGGEELAAGQVTVKYMRESRQEQIDREHAAPSIAATLGRKEDPEGMY